MVGATLQSKQWNGAVKLKLPVTVISATSDTIDAAITDENMKAKTVDLHIFMAAPMRKPPVAGAAISVTGVITAYKPRPFMSTMMQGRL
jgi:hypothetical protein